MSETLKLPLTVTDDGFIFDAVGHVLNVYRVDERRELVRLVNSHAAQASLLNGALETIDAICAIANGSGRSSINLKEVAYTIELFRKAYPNSHSQMARDAAAETKP